jgi:hypothetical protein
MTTESTNFWDVTACSLVEVHRFCWRTHCFRLQGWRISQASTPLLARFFPEFKMILLWPWIQFWLLARVPKCLNLTKLSKDLIAMFIKVCSTLCYMFICLVSLRIGLTFFISTLSCFYSMQMEGRFYLFVCSHFCISRRTVNTIQSTAFHSQSPAVTLFMCQYVFLTLAGFE